MPILAGAAPPSLIWIYDLIQSLPNPVSNEHVEERMHSTQGERGLSQKATN